MQRHHAVTAGPRRSTSLIALLGALAITAVLALGTERAAAATVVDQYCSPSGDYCTFVKQKGDSFILAIESFAFFGPYEVCVKPKGESKICHKFVIDDKADDMGLYRDSVNWAKKFPSDNSASHKVTWFLDDLKLGLPLKFNP